MKLKDAGIDSCRYSEELLQLFGHGEVLSLSFDDDGYQGFVNILLFVGGYPDVYVDYEYFYGSCSVCDEWEARELNTFEIMQEMLKHAAIMTRDVAKKYFANRKDDDAKRIAFENHLRKTGYWEAS